MKIIALLLAAALSTCAAAQDEQGYSIVKSGMAAYKADGAQAAINAWMIGSPMALSREPQIRVHALRAFEDKFGAYRGFHFVHTSTISPTVLMIYIQLDYLNGPAFGKFLVYQTKTAWTVTSFDFGADPEALWGVSLFSAFPS